MWLFDNHIILLKSVLQSLREFWAIVFCYCFVNMPKIKPNIFTIVKSYIFKFDENAFSCDKFVLFCKLCETKVSAE